MPPAQRLRRRPPTISPIGLITARIANQIGGKTAVIARALMAGRTRSAVPTKVREKTMRTGRAVTTTAMVAAMIIAAAKNAGRRNDNGCATKIGWHRFVVALRGACGTEGPNGETE